MLKSPFATNLKKVRLELGQTQQESADNARIPAKSWGSYEEDRATPPDLAKLVRITRSLGVPDEDLALFLTDHEYMKKRSKVRAQHAILTAYNRAKPRTRQIVEVALGIDINTELPPSKNQITS